jgi:hypothetical protein
MDAGACYPEEVDCSLDWECPYLEDCEEDCEYCSAECDDRYAIMAAQDDE